MTQFNYKVEDPSKYAYQIVAKEIQDFKNHSSSDSISQKEGSNSSSLEGLAKDVKESSNSINDKSR